MANSLEIRVDKSRLTLLLDGQEIKGIKSLKLEHQGRHAPLLSLQVFITGPVLCRVSGEDPQAQAIRLGLEDVLKDWTPTIHGIDEGTPD